MASTTKRTQTTDTGHGTDATGSATAGLADVTRQQMAAATEMVGAMFRAGEAISRANLQMGQRASLLHGQAAENLRKATNPFELVTIQSTLAVYQAQEAMRYWQEITTAMVKAGGEVMRPVQGEETTATAPQAAASPAATMMDAALSAAAPMAEAMQQMFTAPLKAAQPPTH